ncbi:MAG: hypothetical protein OQK04_07700 [Kangiellaceae bacterium]|nr:hypothetical protein [Kangiellaceae bacterium]MCW8998584.1 hypothetical protein [Kangiellaceae bacterium]
MTPFLYILKDLATNTWRNERIDSSFDTAEAMGRLKAQQTIDNLNSTNVFGEGESGLRDYYLNYDRSREILGQREFVNDVVQGGMFLTTLAAGGAALGGAGIMGLGRFVGTQGLKAAGYGYSAGAVYDVAVQRAVHGRSFDELDFGSIHATGLAAAAIAIPATKLAMSKSLIGKGLVYAAGITGSAFEIANGSGRILSGIKEDNWAKIALGVADTAGGLGGFSASFKLVGAKLESISGSGFGRQAGAIGVKFDGRNKSIFDELKLPKKGTLEYRRLRRTEKTMSMETIPGAHYGKSGGDYENVLLSGTPHSRLHTIDETLYLGKRFLGDNYTVNSKGDTFHSAPWKENGTLYRKQFRIPRAKGYDTNLVSNYEVQVGRKVFTYSPQDKALKSPTGFYIEYRTVSDFHVRTDVKK